MGQDDFKPPQDSQISRRAFGLATAAAIGLTAAETRALAADPKAPFAAMTPAARGPIDPTASFRKTNMDVAAELTGQTEARLADLRNGAAWDAVCDSLRQMGKEMLASDFAADDRERANGYRYMLGLVTSRMHKYLYHSGPELPAFVMSMDDVLKWGLDNPDGINSKVAEIRDDLTYRLYGRAGGERYVEFVQSGERGTISNHFLTQFEVGKDGRFEIFLSKEPHPGNWLPMAPGARNLLVRRIQYDWDKEGYTEIHIERPGVTGVPDCLKIPEPVAVAAELRALSKTLLSEFELWLDYTQGFRSGGDNVIPQEQPLAFSGKTKVRFHPKGFFVLEPDQALLLEFEDPGGLFWSVAVGDTWFRSIDPSHRHSSLNGAQAHRDADGLYRVVIAHQDPGIANWLDTAGQRRGIMTFRFVMTDRWPAPRTKVAPLPDIIAGLPRQTARVTREARAEIIERRAQAYARRYAEPLTSRWSRFE